MMVLTAAFTAASGPEIMAELLSAEVKRRTALVAFGGTVVFGKASPPPFTATTSEKKEEHL